MLPPTAYKRDFTLPPATMMATIGRKREIALYVDDAVTYMLSAMPAHAQDATWSSNPFTASYDLFFNWTRGRCPLGQKLRSHQYAGPQYININNRGSWLIRCRRWLIRLRFLP